MGPTGRVSFKDTPVEDLPEALNTALTLVVVLESLYRRVLGDRTPLKEDCPCPYWAQVQHVPDPSIPA